MLRTMTALATINLLAACSSGHTPSGSDHSHVEANSAFPFWVQHMDPDTMIGEPKLVDCTLSSSAQTHCVSLTLKPEPSTFEIGPWCPRNISDGPNVSGIWLDNGKVYDADGQFIQNLATFYKDSNWQLFDPETGKINVTDTKTSCEAAARPDVDPAYQNHCVECQMSYLPDGTSMTYVIPLSPEPAQSIAPRIDHAGVGVAFGGARLDASAPIDDILAAYTIAAFDDCGGHINPNVGYHIHAVTDTECLSRVPVKADHAAQIGIAMDGYTIHTRLNPNGLEASNLDQCRGHDVEGLGYHYHANDPGANAILPCHTGQKGCAMNDDDGVCDASATVRRGPPRGERPPRRE